MAKNTKKHPISLRLLLLLILAFFVLAGMSITSLIPTERMRYSGGCPSKDIRLSLVLDGQKKINEAREKIEKMNRERQERHSKYPGLSEGCGAGVSYAVYLL